MELTEHSNETSNNATVTATATAPAPAAVSTTVSGAETRSFWHGHRFLNFLLACMVFAFVISWLFHFNVPSWDPVKNQFCKRVQKNSSGRMGVPAQCQALRRLYSYLYSCICLHTYIRVSYFHICLFLIIIRALRLVFVIPCHKSAIVSSFNIISIFVLLSLHLSALKTKSCKSFLFY